MSAPSMFEGREDTLSTPHVLSFPRRRESRTPWAKQVSANPSSIASISCVNPLSPPLAKGDSREFELGTPLILRRVYDQTLGRRLLLHFYRGALKTRRPRNWRAGQHRHDGSVAPSSSLTGLPIECSPEKVRYLPSDLALESPPEMVRSKHNLAFAGRGSLPNEPLHFVGRD
jgi:hypothetical protein